MTCRSARFADHCYALFPDVASRNCAEVVMLLHLIDVTSGNYSYFSLVLGPECITIFICNKCSGVGTEVGGGRL